MANPFFICLLINFYCIDSFVGDDKYLSPYKKYLGSSIDFIGVDGKGYFEIIFSANGMITLELDCYFHSVSKILHAGIGYCKIFISVYRYNTHENIVPYYAYNFISHIYGKRELITVDFIKGNFEDPDRCTVYIGVDSIYYQSCHAYLIKFHKMGSHSPMKKSSVKFLYGTLERTDVANSEIIFIS